LGFFVIEILPTQLNPDPCVTQIGSAATQA
jgi:hypothetical protein